MKTLFAITLLGMFLFLCVAVWIDGRQRSNRKAEFEARMAELDNTFARIDSRPSPNTTPKSEIDSPWGERVTATSACYAKDGSIYCWRGEDPKRIWVKPHDMSMWWVVLQEKPTP